jgi:hypothetical protein
MGPQPFLCQIAMACDHSGTHSGASRYVREAGELRLVLLCDRCGAERRELDRVGYRPELRGTGHPRAGLTAGGLAVAATMAAPLH